ncbi:MAG: M14 family metallopeptidase [Planctomycetota bacterium]
MRIRDGFMVWHAMLIISLFGCISIGMASEVPDPEEILGFKPGTDSKLADWDMILRYFQALDQASDRVTIEKIGWSSMGRVMIVAVISSEANVAKLREIKTAMKRLSDPRSLPLAEAQALAAETPLVLFVGCAQHAREIASTQMSMSLARRMAIEETPEMESIRKNVVLLLVPSMNPDGHQMECDWYEEHLATPFEGSRMPWLYHKYVGHDNNRDWAMITQAETRNISRVLYEEWFPPIVIDIHQMGNRGARMFIPPYYDPINPNIDPLIQHELALISAQMQLDLSTAGHTGIITNAMFDEWLLGYFTSVPTRHNMVAQLIEMASVNLASPLFQRRSELRVSWTDADYGRRFNFPEPWEGGWWRLGDIVSYEEDAVLSALKLASRNRGLFVENFYRMGGKQIEAGKTEPPFAYLVPPGQNDPATAWEMIATLMRGGVEIHEARAPFKADAIEYGAGTYVISMAQPYRAHAKDLLEQQTYPNLRSYPGGPPRRPYDVAGWTLSLLMDVETVQVIEPFEAQLEKVEKQDAPPAGQVRDFANTSRYILIERSQNRAFTLVNRLLALGAEVDVLTEEIELNGKRIKAGAFVLDIEKGAGNEIAQQIKAAGLRALAVDSMPEGIEPAPLRPVRLGMYQPWTASMDEGWTRWVLEEFEFPYRTIHDAEIRAGRLKDRYDVILFPDLSPRSIIEGRGEGELPDRYTGGIGKEGVFALRDFFREGGTLIAMDSSCDFLIDQLELPVKNILKRERSAEERMREYMYRPEKGDDEKRFFCPGSLLRIDVDPSHPLAYGMNEAAPVMYVNSPVFQCSEKPKDKKEETKKIPRKSGFEVDCVGTYPNMNPLMSGWIENNEVIHGKAALVQARLEKGTAVLIGFRSQFRAQAHGTFKVLFNAIFSAGVESKPEKDKR